MCEMTSDKFQMKKPKLNRLLGYTLQRLKSKYPLTLKDQRLPPPNKNILVSDRLAQVSCYLLVTKIIHDLLH